MNKFLRYSMMAVLAVFGFGNAMAESVIWQEDFSSYAAGDVPSGGTYNYVCTDGASTTKIYEEALAQGTSPELLVSKKASGAEVGGTFSATINLGGASGDMTLSFKSNKKLSVIVEGGTIGENTGSGNDYVYAITGASGTLTITFANTLTANARLDNIKLFQGQGKKPAGLSWGTSSRTVTIGGDDNVFPTLTNDNNLPVTYSSSDTGVATISGDGTITLVSAGQTVITAESAETSEYEAGHASYTLTVKEAEGGGGGEQVQQITVARALEIIDGLENGKTTTEEYQVKGFIVGTPAIDKKEDNTFYGNANFYLADTKGGSTTIYGYHIKGLNNENMDREDYLKENDEVIVQCKLQKYVKGDVVTPEMTKGYIYQIVSTGINNIKADELKNAPAYNVAGQKVAEGYKGLIIKGGKKVVMK